VRWLLVAILGYASLAIQTAVFRPGGLALPIDGHWARPDLALVFGLFLALYFRPGEVFVAAWCLGMASDLVAVGGRLGTGALLFCGVLTGLSYLRESLNRRWIFTQSLLAFATVLLIHLAWQMASRYFAGAPLGVLRSVETSVLDAAYAAILAPYLIWLLMRLRGPLGVTVEPYEI